MNRFFSKLDLRDIKIDPESTRFPPDEDEQRADSAEATLEPEPDVDVNEDSVAGFEEPVVADLAEVADTVIPASENGHATPEAVELISNQQQSDEVLKVSARSRPSAVAGAIAGVVREYGRAEVQAIGAGATNQAV